MPLVTVSVTTRDMSRGIQSSFSQPQQQQQPPKNRVLSELQHRQHQLSFGSVCQSVLSHVITHHADVRPSSGRWKNLLLGCKDEDVLHEVLQGRLCGHSVVHEGRLQRVVLVIADDAGGQRVVAHQVRDDAPCCVKACSLTSSYGLVKTK